MKITCNTCVFAKNGKMKCAILDIPIDSNKHCCAFHTTQDQSKTCQLCSRIILGPSTYVDELQIEVCQECSLIVYTCETCKYKQKAPQCVLEQYHGPLDTFIKVRGKVMGGMFEAEALHLNPEVLNQVCPTCKCGSPYNCQRNHKCNNWEANIQ